MLTKSLAHRALATLVAVSVLASGCHGSPSTSEPAAAPATIAIDPADQTKVDKLRALPFGETSLAVVAAVLSDAGVGVYADTVTTGTEPVRFQRWQVRHLAIEAANGGGVTGATLAELDGRADGKLPISYLLAAWVSQHRSPAAGFARALMGERDWHQAESVVFPKLVLTLFTADAAAAAGSATASTGTLRPAAWTVADGPCTAVSGFVNGAINGLAALLKVDTSGGGILGFLGTIWNIAVDLAAGAVKGLIKAVTNLLLEPFIETLALLGAIDQITSYLVNWRAVVNLLPEQTVFGVDTDVVTGRVEVVVTDNQLELPPIVRDCARHFGTDFDKIGSAADSPITWKDTPHGRADLARRIRADAKVNQQRTATLTYQTGQETAELAESPNRATGLYEVSAEIRRYDLGALQTLLAKAFSVYIPADITKEVLAIKDKVTGAGQALVDDYTGVKVGGRLVTVIYHEPDDKTAGPTRPAQPSVRGRIPTRCPGASRISAITGIFFDLGEKARRFPGQDPMLDGCAYGSESQRIGFELGLGSFHDAVVDADGARVPGDQAVTVPGSDRAWYLAEDGNSKQEHLVVVVGDRYMLISIAYADGRQNLALRVASELIANPDIGPFLA